LGVLLAHEIIALLLGRYGLNKCVHRPLNE